MFYKRTRLFVHFNLINFFQILKSFFIYNKDFSEHLKKFLKVKNLVLTSYGRTALYDIIKIIISKNNKKIFFIAPYTIPEVIHAITYAGGKVSYIDIDHTTGLINENELEKNIDENTAGVIITHLYSENNSIKNFINKFKNKIFIIEDAAINLGAKVENSFLGTLGDFGFFSFALVKNLNTFTGGAIYIKDNNIFNDYISKRKVKNFPFNKTINLLLTTLFIKFFFNNFTYQITHYFLRFVYLKNIKFVLKKIYPVLFHKLEEKIPEIYSYDFNWHLNDVGIYNLKKIQNDLEERIAKGRLYKELINNNVAIKTNCLSGDNAILEFTVILKTTSNLKAHSKLMQEGYDVRHTWYINNMKSNKYLNKDNFKDTFLIDEKILCLPLHKNISNLDIKRISNIINTLI
jgi:dTDP-4-amino-4,6-dideoxygalactose transaminase